MLGARWRPYQDFLFQFSFHWGTYRHMHETFDPEPIRELPSDEPRTPMWLPAVGVVVFLALGAFWCRKACQPGSVSAVEAGPSSSAVPSAAPPAANRAPTGMHP